MPKSFNRIALVLVSFLLPVVGGVSAQAASGGGGVKKRVSAPRASQPVYNESQVDEPAGEPSSLIEGVTFDLGASTGSYDDRSYTEANLGLNLYFKPYLAWRNAVFARFASGADTLYGLDSSARGILDVGTGAAGFTAFAGPGFRFINKGDNVPFAEGGLVLKLAGLSLGGGVKTFFNSAVRSGAPNDTQYFIILAGGGSL